MEAENEQSLITDDEADAVIKHQGGNLVVYRGPLLVISGIIVAITLTLLIMILLSLRGTETGLSSILPFLK